MMTERTYKGTPEMMLVLNKTDHTIGTLNMMFRGKESDAFVSIPVVVKRTIITGDEKLHRRIREEEKGDNNG